MGKTRVFQEQEVGVDKIGLNQNQRGTKNWSINASFVTRLVTFQELSQEKDNDDFVQGLISS